MAIADCKRLLNGYISCLKQKEGGNMGKKKMDLTTAKHYSKVLKKMAKNQSMQMTFNPLQENRLKYYVELLKMIFFLNKIIPKNKRLVFLCIGASNYMGDLFGPFIGELLKRPNKSIIVYGELCNCVHGGNLLEYIKMIYKKHKDDFIITIDAGTSSAKKRGSISVYRRGICPGRSYHSGTAKVGDVSILGFTEKTYEDLLKLTPEDTFLYDMGNFTAKAIITYLDWFNPVAAFPQMDKEQELLQKKNKTCKMERIKFRV